MKFTLTLSIILGGNKFLFQVHVPILSPLPALNNKSAITKFCFYLFKNIDYKEHIALTNDLKQQVQRNLLFFFYNGIRWGARPLGKLNETSSCENFFHAGSVKRKRCTPPPQHIKKEQKSSSRPL